VQKIGGRRWNFFLLKVLEGVLHHWQKLSLTASVFVETSTHTYSLSEEGFGLLSYLEKHFAIFSVDLLLHRNMNLVRFIGRLQRAKCISTLSCVRLLDITQNAISVLLFTSCHHKIRINTVIKNNSLTNGYFSLQAASELDAIASGNLSVYLPQYCDR